MELYAKLNSAAKLPFRGRTQPSQQTTLLHDTRNVLEKREAEKETFGKLSLAEYLYFRFSLPIGATRRPTSVTTQATFTHRHSYNAHRNKIKRKIKRARAQERKRESGQSVRSTDGCTLRDEHTRARGPHVRFNRTLN